MEPAHWVQVEADRWQLELQCPECGAEQEMTLDAESVHAYNVLLYEAAEAMQGAAGRLLEEWTSDLTAGDRRFVEALRHGHILPIDF